MATALAIVTFATAVASASAQALITVDFTYALTSVAETYLSLNIDSGSLYNDFDLTDPMLNQLVANLVRAAPLQVRFGGSAANDVTYTGHGGARGNCSSGGVTRICVDDSLWDEINAFANKTGAGLVWDLPINPRTPSGAWNATNSEALIQRTAAAGYVLAAWQLGNEEEDMIKHGANFSAVQIAADFHTLRGLLDAASPSVGSTIYGPDSCCDQIFDPPGLFLSTFVAGAGAILSGVTVHDYPLGRAPNRSCVPEEYTNLTQFRSLPVFIANYTGYVVNGSGAATPPPVILGEVASTAEGGCDGLSNRFVAGFVFIYELAATAEAGAVQLNRQDVAGWSSETTASNYGLLGVPGWSSTALDGPPTPHPDYFLALLFKQLAGGAVLASTVASAPAGFDAHIWCASQVWWPAGVPGSAGAVVVSFVNMAGTPASFSFAGQTSGPAGGVGPYLAYVITSAATSEPSSGDTPPPSVFGDSAFLNGTPLVVDPQGRLPVWPLPGLAVAAGSELIEVPPWSYGFYVMQGVPGLTPATGCPAPAARAA